MKKQKPLKVVHIYLPEWDYVKWIEVYNAKYINTAFNAEKHGEDTEEFTYSV